MLLIAAVLFGSIQMPAVSCASQVVTTAEVAEDGQTSQDGTVSDSQAQADQEDQDTGDSKDQNITYSGKKKASTKKTNKSYSAKQLRLMAAIINCEAGAESYQGKLAVGIVVMNRKRSSSFPNTVSGVLKQRRQFTPVATGKWSKEMKRYDKGAYKKVARAKCLKAAKDALAGEKTVTYRGKEINMKRYHFFSQRLKNAKLRISGHDFK